MRYEQRPGGTAAVISTGLRQRFEVVDGEFEVPDDLDSGAHQRLIDAGHEPLEPESLPSGVTYNGGGSEESESGDESDSEDGPTDGPSESESEESASESGEDTGAMTSDALGGSEEPPEPPEPLDEMNRSELYSFANEELGLSLEWSGEEALNEEEMRERISEEVSDGE